MEELFDAVRRMFADKGSGYCFPPDKLWEYVDPTALRTSPHALINLLKKSDFIVKTGASTAAVSEARKGAPVTEYTFGAAIDPQSLENALAKKFGGGMSSPHQTSPQNPSESKNSDGVYPLNLPLQRIIYGCPGSGKSYKLNEDASKAHFYFRTVFFQESSYYDFVGGLKPQSVYRVSDEPPTFIGSTIDVPGEPVIQYVVQPGPFLKAYKTACDNPGCSVVLIIEELSRAVPAHVFGDILQLLDRHETGDLAGVSEYEVDARPDIESWLLLNNVTHQHATDGKLRLPANLYIWATMNRADQNARQIDAAFLRRWSKTYVSYLEAGQYDNETVRYGGTDIPWGKLRQAVNGRLLDLGGVAEDKLVGPYMLSKSKLAHPDEVFEELWGYLWNDVLKTRASQLFIGNSTLAQLKESWASGDGAIIGDLDL